MGAEGGGGFEGLKVKGATFKGASRGLEGGFTLEGGLKGAFSFEGGWGLQWGFKGGLKKKSWSAHSAVEGLVRGGLEGGFRSTLLQAPLKPPSSLEGGFKPP